MRNSQEKTVVFGHPLMQNNIDRTDLDVLIRYLQEDEPRLTQGENVQAFEEEWSDWLGVSYSVFVNSGSCRKSLQKLLYWKTILYSERNG